MFRLLRQEDVRDWLPMPCARRVSSARIQPLVEELRRSERFEGVLSLAVVEGKIYILDGLHRVEAFRQSKLGAMSVEVRVYRYDTIQEATKKWTSFHSLVGGHAALKKRVQN